MNREEYLSEVWKRIGYLPPEDIRRSLDYYREMIDDRMESDSLTEAEAVAAMPTVEEAATQILADTPAPAWTESGGAPLSPEDISHRTCAGSNVRCDTPSASTAWTDTGGAPPPKRRIGFWLILLLVLGSPLWLPLVIVLGSLLLVAYILVWVLVVVVFAVLLSFGASGVAWIIYGVVQLVTGGIIQGVFYLGGALMGIGLLGLMLPVCKWVVKGAVYLCKLPFRRRGGN